MKNTVNWLALGLLWVVTLIVAGAVGRLAWFFLQIGWEMLA